MAVQNPFFGKRENENFSTPRAAGSPLGAGTSSSYGSGATPSSAATPSTSSLARPVSNQNSSSVSDTGGSKLTVGPNIKLKGVEITDCDTLVVEGTVEATMNSRVIHIAEQGAFRGSAEIDIAEIHGSFEGELTVRQKLVIFSTGRVNGKIRYGKIVIEEGGQLSGDIQVGTTSSLRSASTSLSSESTSSLRSADDSSTAATSLAA